MASLDHEMTINLDVKPSPAMYKFAQTIVRETFRQAQDKDIIENATDSNTLARELAGRVVKIEGPSLAATHVNVTFADTGEGVSDIRRVELVLDAQTGEMEATLYRWKLDGDEAALERATTHDVEVSTLARAKRIAS